MFIKKLISVALCIVLLMASVVALVPEMNKASAATYVKGSNTAHATYLTSKYYDHFTKVVLTGDNRTDVLAVALSQLGYRESSSESNMSGIVTETTAGNYTEYNYNMGDWGAGYAYDWCATFCAWALLQSGSTDQDSISDWCRKHDGDGDTFDANYIWREVGCPSWVFQLKNTGYFEYGEDKGGDYIPKSGDLIFFQNAGSSSVSHIGIVVYTDDTYVYTVEGNTSDQSGLEPNGNGVYFKKYVHESSYILGYGAMPYKSNDNIVTIDYSGASPSAGLYISDRVKSVYTTEDGTSISATMPRFTLFEVTEIAENGRLKANYTDASGNTVSGWVVNDSERVIQLTTTATKETVSTTVKCVDENGNVLKTETLTGNKGTTTRITPPAITGYTCDVKSAVITYKSGATVTLNYKPALVAAIDAASGTRYCDYTPEALATLRSLYDEAVAMQNSSSATSEQKIAIAEKLQEAIADNIYNETIVSKGKTYTTTATERTDKWADDGVRLTDGVKGAMGNTEGFAGWGVGAYGKAEIIVDLGASVASSVYRIYNATNEGWGILLPASLKISVSNDKSSWTDVGTAVSEDYIATQGEWMNYTMTVRAEKEQTARYIKFTVTAVKGHVWLEEVEVISAGVGATGETYVDGINTAVTEGKTVVFTSDFGDITAANANHKYTLNIVAAFDSANGNYVVKSASYGNGDATPTVKLASGEVLIACHEWENDVTDPVFRSGANLESLKNVRVGDTIVFDNVDIENGTLGAAAVLVLSSDGSGEVVTPSSNLALSKSYTLSGVYCTDGTNADYPDENGKTITDGATAPSDAGYSHDAFVGFNKGNSDFAANGYASITVDLGGVYSLDRFVTNVASAYNEVAGIVAPSKVSVYVSTDNKTWTEAGSATPTDSSTVSSLNVSVSLDAAVSARYVQFRYESTKNWIMVSEVEVYGKTADGLLGDVDNNGKVESVDYLLVKRSCFNTYSLSADEKTRANVNGDGNIDSVDYVLIKRIVFGTYVA